PAGGLPYPPPAAHQLAALAGGPPHRRGPRPLRPGAHGLGIVRLAWPRLVRAGGADLRLGADPGADPPAAPHPHGARSAGESTGSLPMLGAAPPPLARRRTRDRRPTGPPPVETRRAIRWRGACDRSPAATGAETAPDGRWPQAP